MGPDPCANLGCRRLQELRSGAPEDSRKVIWGNNPVDGTRAALGPDYDVGRGGAPDLSSCKRPHPMLAHGSGPIRCGAVRSSIWEAYLARMPPHRVLVLKTIGRSHLHYPGINRVVSTFTNRHTARNSHPETGPSDPCERHRREMVTHGNGQ